MLALFLSGLASDYTLEGPSSIRTASVITNRPQEMTAALMAGLDRGVSRWEITGGYTGETRHMIFCTIFRPQVNDLKRIVAQVDEDAFVGLGQNLDQKLSFLVEARWSMKNSVSFWPKR